jgi:hypothetical protein
MKIFRLFIGIIFIYLVIVGCTLLTPTSPPVPPTTTPAATKTAHTATPVLVQLTTTQLKNTEYKLPQYHKTVKLVDGHFTSDSGADMLDVSLLDPVAFGDLNGDGLPDAAVLLAENGGGTGVFVSLVVMLNQDGQPVQGDAELVDDRPLIHSLTIQDGQIILKATIHAASDPMCCPSLAVTKTYKLVGEKLEVVK